MAWILEIHQADVLEGHKECLASAQGSPTYPVGENNCTPLKVDVCLEGSQSHLPASPLPCVTVCMCLFM